MRVCKVCEYNHNYLTFLFYRNVTSIEGNGDWNYVSHIQEEQLLKFNFNCLKC